MIKYEMIIASMELNNRNFKKESVIYVDTILSYK